jgi:hypothetical protein
MGIIFFVGVLFSIYSIYFVSTYEVTSMKAIETVIGPVRADVIGAFGGAEGIKVNRVGLPGPNASTYGSLLVLVVLTGLLFYKTSHGLVKGMFLGATLFLVGCLVLSFTRGAIVSLIAAFLYLVWKRFFTMRDFAIVVPVLAVSLVVLIGVSGYDKIEKQAEHLMTRFGTVGMADGSLEYRIEAAQQSVVLWKSCPLIGCGSIGEGDHNYYTRMLASRGLVAFIPFMCFVWLLFRGVWTGGMYMNETVRPMMHIFSAGIVGIMVNHLVLGLAEFFYAWIWFGLVAAWINISSGMEVGGRGRHLARVLGDPRASS